MVFTAVVSFDHSNIAIEKLNMRFGRCHIITYNNDVAIGHITKNGSKYLAVGMLSLMNSDIGIDVDTRRINEPKFHGIKIVGGEVSLEGTGILLGKGASSILVNNIRVYNV